MALENPRTIRILRLVLMLCGNRYYNISELMKLLSISERTVYRDLDTLENVGFDVERNEGQYRIHPTSATKTVLSTIQDGLEEIALRNDSPPGTFQELELPYFLPGQYSTDMDTLLIHVKKMPYFSGKEKKSPRTSFAYFLWGKLEAMRMGDWKLRSVNGVDELYHMQMDPGEKYNRAKEKPGIVKEIKMKMKAMAGETGAKIDF